MTDDVTPRLELHIHFDADGTLATALAAAGVTPEGPIGVAQVWVTNAADVATAKQ